jgi:hypothetical protein
VAQHGKAGVARLLLITIKINNVAWAFEKVINVQSYAIVVFGVS